MKSSSLKILLIVPRYDMTRQGPSNQANFNYFFPVGLGYISAVMKQAGHRVDCLNLNHFDGTVNALVAASLAKCDYDVVCTGNNALGYWVTRLIIDAVRQHRPRVKFILGGPIITTEPELMFQDLAPDFGVLGEGEQTIVELLAGLREGTPLDTIDGIIYKNTDGQLVVTKGRAPQKDLDALPYPDFEGLEFVKLLDKTNTFLLPGLSVVDSPRIYPLVGSRSCPFSCTFCYHDSTYRSRSIESMMQELAVAVPKYRVNLIMIYDDCFSATKTRIYDFCKRIKELQAQVGWDIKWACQLIVKTVDREMLVAMKDAGCVQISYGFESYSATVLKSMRKWITPQQIDEAFHTTMDLKINVQANFIFGDVAETMETALETLNYWKAKGRGQIGLGFIQPYPGSAIYKHCVQKGLIANKLTFITDTISSSWDSGLNMTDQMSDEQVAWLRKELLLTEGKHVQRVTPRSLKPVGSNKYDATFICPFCDHVNEYKGAVLTSRFTFNHLVACRSCSLRYGAVGLVAKVAYKYYPLTRKVRDLQLKLSNYVNRLKGSAT
jgi:anaerobic magnesium-protoporphyrin IX monomethyl ester cyclase